MSIDIAISLGTTNTKIYTNKKGMVLNEPSVVTIDVDKDSVVATGQKAYDMIGKTSDKIKIVYPLEGGVVSNFDLVVDLIDSFLKKLNLNKLIMPKAVVCIPVNITEVEKRAIIDAMNALGIRKVCLIEKSIAAALGAGIDIDAPNGNMIVNVGGGNSEIAIISLNGIAACRIIKFAGNDIDEKIIKYVKSNYNIIIGKQTAKKIKETIGNVFCKNKKIFEAKGRDIITGMPKCVCISSNEISDIINNCALKIIKKAQELLEETPAELAGDIYVNGITFTGGCAHINGFDKLLSKETGLKVFVPENPQNCAILGAGIATNYIDSFNKKFSNRINPLKAVY